MEHALIQSYSKSVPPCFVKLKSKPEARLILNKSGPKRYFLDAVKTHGPPTIWILLSYKHEFIPNSRACPNQLQV